MTSSPFQFERHEASVAAPSRAVRGRDRSGFARFQAVPAWILLFAIAFGHAARLPAQEAEVLHPRKECQVKYALLYAFGLLTTWPDEAFAANADAPFVIGVLGTKPYPEYLDHMAATKKIHGRSIIVRRHRSPDEVSDCHILYLTEQLEADTQAAVVRRFAKQSVLIVGEGSGSVESEPPPPIRFFFAQGTVKFTMDVEAMKARKLQVDARLVRLAQ